jgi:hypothetical protein
MILSNLATFSCTSAAICSGVLVAGSGPALMTLSLVCHYNRFDDCFVERPYDVTRQVPRSRGRIDLRAGRQANGAARRERACATCRNRFVKQPLSREI